MLTDKAINILRSCEKDDIEKLINQLNIDGIVSDEDKCLISSYMVKNWDSRCTDYLTSHGYEGGCLRAHGKFFENHGAVYVLFDENKHAYRTANDYMNHNIDNSWLKFRS